MTPLFSIPKPCSEKWNEMDATAQGAFCAKCTKEVVDCSTIKTSEIKATLATKESPCVRIFNAQIDEMNFLEWFGSFSLKKQLKYAFLFAYLLVFCSNGRSQDSLASSKTTELDSNFVVNERVELDSLIEPFPKDSLFSASLNDSITGSIHEVTDTTQYIRSEKETIQSDSTVLPEDVMIHYEPHIIGDYYVEVYATLGFIAINPDPVEEIDRSPFLADARSQPPLITDSPNLSLENSRFSFHIEGDNLRFFSYAIHSEIIELSIAKKGQNNIVFSKSLKIKSGPAETLFPLSDFDNGIYIITINTEKSTKAIELIYW